MAIAALYYFPTTYLYRFSVSIKRGIEEHNFYDVTNGFENLKSLFKFMGILLIVTMIIYAVAIMLVIAVAGFTGFN